MVKASLLTKPLPQVDSTIMWYHWILICWYNWLWLEFKFPPNCTIELSKKERENLTVVLKVQLFIKYDSLYPSFVRVLFIFLKLAFVCREQYGFWNQKRFQKICWTKAWRSKRERKISWRFPLLKSTPKSRTESLFWLNRMVPKLLLSLRDA